MISNGMKSLSSPCPLSSIWEKGGGNLKPAILMPISQLRREGHISLHLTSSTSQWYREQGVRTQSHPWDLSLLKRLCQEVTAVIFIYISCWSDKGSMSSKVQPLGLQHTLKVEAKKKEKWWLEVTGTALDGFLYSLIQLSQKTLECRHHCCHFIHEDAEAWQDEGPFLTLPN